MQIFSLVYKPKNQLKVTALVTQLCPTLCDPKTVACRASLSLGFSRQEYCSGLPFPSPEDLPDPGIEPAFPVLQADSIPLVLHSHRKAIHQ